MKPVILSGPAEAELESIGDYIAVDNPMRAVTFVREIREHCHKIGLMPQAHSRRDDLVPGLRMAVYGVYLIFYRDMDDHIKIEHILHGARDYGEMFQA